MSNAFNVYSVKVLKHFTTEYLVTWYSSEAFVDIKSFWHLIFFFPVWFFWDKSKIYTYKYLKQFSTKNYYNSLCIVFCANISRPQFFDYFCEKYVLKILEHFDTEYIHKDLIKFKTLMNFNNISCLTFGLKLANTPKPKNTPVSKMC